MTNTQTTNINQAKFEAYTAVQISGITNMWNVPLVMELSGLTKAECFDIMQNYREYDKMFVDR